MCGIYGQWDATGGAIDVAAVRAATTAIRHRGPDDEGYLLVDTAGRRHVSATGPESVTMPDLPRVESLMGERFDLAFGFRRLAILDLSPAGHQPMTAPGGQQWIVFNGEIYNYRELRAELEPLGHHFRSGADTEVLLAAYRQWGPACLHRFNGMWAFAIWDADSRTLFLARDRFGVKPLYYAWDGRRFSFASEIKALVGRHGLPFAANEEAVCHYLVAGLLPRPRTGETFFRGVQAIPAGHSVTVAQGRLELRRYYALPEGGEPAGDAASAVTGYRELFTDAVRLRLRADVPVGTCLSGGVDSSAIVCVMHGLMRAPDTGREPRAPRQQTISAVYDSAGPYNEREHIERVLAACGAESQFTFPTADRLQTDLARLAWHQDEPFGSTSIFAQWCVMAAARERGITVLLDGQGADETLAGYRPYDIFLADLIQRHRYAQAIGAGRAIERTAGVGAGGLLARALVRQLPSGPLDALRRHRRRGARMAVRAELVAAHGASLPVRPVNRDLGDYLRELLDDTSLPHLLRYEDRNAMAFGVEGRVPFLDYRLVEYALTRARPWAIHDGWTKWVLRQAMRGIVPDAIAWRRDKVGFETPERDWLAAWLRANPSLFGSEALSRDYVDPALLRREVDEWHREECGTARVWRSINVELWLRAFQAR
jgi:asparagine synthase (glutamine-hydrolysing)